MPNFCTQYFQKKIRAWLLNESVYTGWLTGPTARFGDATFKKDKLVRKYTSAQQHLGPKKMCAQHLNESVYTNLQIFLTT